MKIDKSKKNKIKQGNQRDFDLLYDVLVNGGTYSDYRSELLDSSMPQELQNFNISEDDILAAWILGKDEESELYARGGHIHQGLNSNLYRQLFGGTWDHPHFNSTTTPEVDAGLQESTGSGSLLGKIGTALQIADMADKGIGIGLSMLQNGASGANDDPYRDAIYRDYSRGFLSGLFNQPDINDALNRIDSSVLKFGTGDSVYLMSQYDSYNPLLGSNSNPLFSGEKRRQNIINDAVDIANNQSIQNFNTAVTNSNRLNLWNQLSQPYMAACGGKMKNKLASGGYINSHYDYITDPLVKVNAGGTHQENPNEGVLTSIAPDGQPNLVEEGETIINNGLEDAYVFSDRIVADDEILKSHLLPNKFAGKTYADISKELDKIIEEHKNDEISKRTFDEMISRLQQALEDLKFKEKQEEIEKFLDGLTDEQKEQLEQTMVEEAQAEQQATEEQAIAEQQAQEQAAQEQLIQSEQAPEQAAMEQSQEQVVPSRYYQMMSNALFADAADQGMFGLGGHIALKGGKNKNKYAVEGFLADKYGYTTKGGHLHLEDPLIITDLPSLKKYGFKVNNTVIDPYDSDYTNYVSVAPVEINYGYTGEKRVADVNLPDEEMLDYDLVRTTNPNIGIDVETDIPVEPKDETTITKPEKDYSTWLRFAPAVGSGIQYLSDLFGITNRNDYTNPNLLQRSINAIPNVGFTPLGGYRTFNPFDETYQLNVLRSANEAARRAVINNSNGNYGATLAALNALNYNEGSQFGDLALKAREYNDKERQAIDEYNLKINQINSTLSMSAQEKNQAIAALKARLTAALAEMRQQIEDTNDAARSANMTNFYQNLGNVGKENFNMTMVRSNPAFYYTITDDGHILYKNGFDGLNERDRAFVRSVAEPQAEEQRKKHLEEANKKTNETTNLDRTYWSPMMYSYFGRPSLFGYRGLTINDKGN